MGIHDVADMIAVIERLDRRFEEVICRVLRQHDIATLTSKEARILLKLEAGRAYLAKEISDLNGGLNIAYNLRQMLENGILERLPHERDGRLVYYKITDQGKTVKVKLEHGLDRCATSLEQAAKSILDIDLIGLSFLLRKLAEAT